MLVRMQTSSGGGGADANLVTVYENGSWKNGYSQSTFSFHNATFNSDSIDIATGEGNGFYSNTDYTAAYKGVHVVFTTTNTGVLNFSQYGICTKTASLPSIVTNGTGRGAYGNARPVFPEKQTIGITLSSGNGFFVGVGTNFPMRIVGIYFVKN